MPSDLQLAHLYKPLAARLRASHEEIARQGRVRPMAEVPMDTLRLVKRLLAEVRRFVGLSNRKARLIPKLPQGNIRFSALSLFLGEACIRFETFGKAFQFDRPAAGSPAAHYQAAEADLSSLIAAATADIRRVREKDAAEREEKRNRDEPEEHKPYVSQWGF